MNQNQPLGALDLQRKIYLGGASGQLPALPFSFEKLEAAAQKKLSAEAFSYIAGGAGDERTMRANRSAFEKFSIAPRMMCDVSACDLGVEIFGKKWPSPFVLSPVGVLELAHPEGDLAAARAAASLSVPMIFSNQASFSMEKTAAEMGNVERWMQLYWSKNDDLVLSFAERAEKCGCSALVVTADTTMLGWRGRDLERASLPFLKGMGIAQYTSDPVFQSLVEASKNDQKGPRPTPSLAAIQTLFSANRRMPGRFLDNLKSGRGLASVRKFVEIYANPGLTWAKIELLKTRTRLPILVKGILRDDDAAAALDSGADGIWVSNHGGRQVDLSVGAVAALPKIAEKVAGRCPILMDSGIRTGADAFVALALGATAVGVGRPFCYGLALGGEAGVREVLQNLIAEFELTMRLSGVSEASKIDRTCLFE